MNNKKILHYHRRVKKAPIILLALLFLSFSANILLSVRLNKIGSDVIKTEAPISEISNTEIEVLEPEVLDILNIDITEDEISMRGSDYPDVTFSYIGDFHVTAYCSCEKCCGKYALDRPRINYKELVFTASNMIAEQGITVAVDPDIIPYGTKIYIEGVGVRIAQDTGGDIKDYRLDVYYSDHEEAWTSGLNDRDRKVWIIEEV